MTLDYRSQQSKRLPGIDETVRTLITCAGRQSLLFTDKCTYPCELHSYVKEQKSLKNSVSPPPHVETLDIQF